jgi:two-component system cell cycle response regulator DivK
MTDYRTHKTVLIVDDNADVREICSLALDHAGYQVLQASDGREGVAIAREALPDLVVIDGRMPVLGGWDAARILKEDSRTRGIPVVAFTASAVTEAQKRMLREVADGYIPKPCSPQEFVAAVARSLAAPPLAGLAAH